MDFISCTTRNVHESVRSTQILSLHATRNNKTATWMTKLYKYGTLSFVVSVAVWGNFYLAAALQYSVTRASRGLHGWFRTYAEVTAGTYWYRRRREELLLESSNGIEKDRWHHESLLVFGVFNESIISPGFLTNECKNKLCTGYHVEQFCAVLK